MATSPYTDPILDYLADGQPHTIAEIRVAIMAPEGAGIDQLLRGMMWELSLRRDPRKLVSRIVERRRHYQIVARDSRVPLVIPVE